MRDEDYVAAWREEGECLPSWLTAAPLLMALLLASMLICIFQWRHGVPLLSLYLTSHHRWQMALGQPPDGGRLCIKALGVDRPCTQRTVRQMFGSCHVRKSSSADARAMCNADVACVGLIYNRERTVVTLKYRIKWMDPIEGAARGWHTAAREVLLPPLSTLLAECQNLSIMLDRHMSRSQAGYWRTSGWQACEQSLAFSWHARSCQEFVSNAFYGGSATHHPTEQCAPTWPWPANHRLQCPPPTRRGCLLVLLRGHAFRRGGQLTTSMNESRLSVASQWRLLGNLRDFVLSPAVAANWSVTSVLVDAAHPAALNAASSSGVQTLETAGLGRALPAPHARFGIPPRAKSRTVPGVAADVPESV